MSEAKKHEDKTFVKIHGEADDLMTLSLYKLESMIRGYYGIGMKDAADKLSKIVEELYRAKELFEQSYNKAFNTWYEENNQHSRTILESVLAISKPATGESK